MNWYLKHINPPLRHFSTHHQSRTRSVLPRLLKLQSNLEQFQAATAVHRLIFWSISPSAASRGPPAAQTSAVHFFCPPTFCQNHFTSPHLELDAACEQFLRRSFCPYKSSLIMDDEALSGFAAITGASPEIARHFLSMTDGNIEQAIQLFFDSPDLSSTLASEPQRAPASQPSRPQQHSSRAGRTDSAGVVHLDSDDDEDMGEEALASNRKMSTEPVTTSTPGNGSYDDDEAMARRIQEEMYAGGDAHGDYDAEGVRAPIARTTETLVGPGADWGPEDMHDAVLQQLRMRQQTRPGRSSSSRYYIR